MALSGRGLSRDLRHSQRRAAGLGRKARQPARRVPIGHPVTPYGLHRQVARLRAEGALRGAGALHRPLPAAGRADAGRGRSVRRDVLLRAGGRARTPAATAGPTSGSATTSPGSTRDTVPTSTPRSSSFGSTRWRRRTRRCSSSPTCCDSGSAPTGPTASARRTSSISKTSPGRRRATSSSGRSRTPIGCGPARPANRSPNGQRRPSPRSHRRCGTAAMRRRPWRTSSTGSSSACSPTTSACCPNTCSHACCGRRGARRSTSPSSPAPSSG